MPTPLCVVWKRRTKGQNAWLSRAQICPLPAVPAGGTCAARCRPVGLTRGVWRVARAPAPGGEAGVVFKRNPTPGTYDYGGVTLGGMLYVVGNRAAK